MSDTPQAAAPFGRDVKQITLLMPVWGYRFVGRFLEFCLPTLLAPNNIPAIAQTLPCRFVLLSSAADEAIIRSHPAWQKLERHCACEIVPIDDLITQGNHTATITLAFERVLRQAGEAMRDTCFIFLMSDYLVADGSLTTVLERVQNGAGAVLVGNFQIITEDAAPLLRQRVRMGSHEIVLRPRQLVRWSLAHLHPATVANIVNFGLTHNAHTNRLFWRVDENTLIGRFYLMHPIAIHPETSDFTVGSSWDYSFVPELCPSGNLAWLGDSDEYLVVELQRRDYEWEQLRSGPINPAHLARSLAEWTTDEHRRNAAHTVVFHGAERPANLAQAVAQADAFIDQVAGSLTAPPRRHERHPYWVGSIAVNRQRTLRPLGKDDWSFLLGDRPPQSRSLLARLRLRLFGSPPKVTSLHPLWPDYQPPLKALDDVLATGGRVLLLAHDSEPFAEWVVGTPADIVTLNADHLLQLSRVQYNDLAGAFDACLIFANESMLDQADVLIEHVGPLLKPSGRIVMTAANSLSAEDVDQFSRNFASQAGRLVNPWIWLEDVQYVPLSPHRQSIRKRLMRLSSTSGRRQLLAPAALPVALANRFANLSARPSSVPLPGAWSSVCLTLRASAQRAPYPLRFTQEAELERDGLAISERAPAHFDAPQAPVGLPTPGLQAGALWQDDEAQLASHLARYRFVTAIMGARHDVAEYGCANPLGTRLVLQQFKKVALFDPRSFVVGDLRWRFQGNWRFSAARHDILLSPLPRQVDSAYSVDFVQYISRDEEDSFVRNLRDSLAHEFDFLLVGSPAYGGPENAAPHHAVGAAASPAIAAELDRDDRSTPPLEAGDHDIVDPAMAPPEAPRIYRRTGLELKALMDRWFQNVFLFSMVDDAAQPGAHPDAQHVFALGCGKKH